MTSGPALPAPFAPLFAGREELRPAYAADRFHQCFGCGSGHAIGLRVRCFRGDGEVLSPIVIPRRFEGPVGAAHGGIVVAYLDEVLAGAALGHAGRTYVTEQVCASFANDAGWRGARAPSGPHAVRRNFWRERISRGGVSWLPRAV